MGRMSASDAAPLPRLGEVFFDVRGESRTMRLSWYADTGVAVFSIWQGGTCTGTFRLPIPDLPRMVEALQRGPHARDDLVPGEQPPARERRPPTVPAQRGPARPSQPELLDGDVATGLSAAAAHLPPAGPDGTGYQAGPPPPGYTGGPPPPGHTDPPGYAGEPALAGHRDPRGYSGEPPPAGGPGYPAGLAEPAQDFTAGYADEPTPDFAAERGPGYSRPPTRRRSSGQRARAEPGYPEDLDPYPGEPGGAGYAGEPADGYLGDDTLLAPGYPEDDQAGPLGAQPVDYGRPRRGHEPGYPAEQDDYEQDDYQRYPEELPATEYDSPVRPYVTDTGDLDEPFAEGPAERRTPRGRRRAGPTADSFPYGPPPAGDEPSPRGRYPGRH